MRDRYRSRPGRVAVVAGAALVAGVTLGIGTVAANANATLPSTTTRVSIRTSKMPEGTAPRTALQSGKAVVSWSAQEIVPGVKMTAYRVTAHYVGDGHRPDVARIVTASGGSAESSTFTAAELGGGTWRWTIAPKFERWVGGDGKRSDAVAFPLPAAPVAPSMTSPPEKVAVDPSPLPEEKTSHPARTESPKVDSTPSEADSVVDPSPSASGTPGGTRRD
jgi:hypothetical protein